MAVGKRVAHPLTVWTLKNLMGRPVLFSDKTNSSFYGLVLFSDEQTVRGVSFGLPLTCSARRCHALILLEDDLCTVEVGS